MPPMSLAVKLIEDGPMAPGWICPLVRLAGAMAGAPNCSGCHTWPVQVLSALPWAGLSQRSPGCMPVGWAVPLNIRRPPMSLTVKETWLAVIPAASEICAAVTVLGASLAAVMAPLAMASVPNCIAAQPEPCHCASSLPRAEFIHISPRRGDDGGLLWT